MGWAILITDGDTLTTIGAIPLIIIMVTLILAGIILTTDGVTQVIMDGITHTIAITTIIMEITITIAITLTALAEEELLIAIQ